MKIIKKYIVIMIALSLFLGACTKMQNISEKCEIGKREKNALYQFGEYLDSIVKTGNRKELDQYIVSNILTWDKVGEIAVSEEAFRHFTDYEQYYFNSAGAVIVEADVNGDGIKDIIEYLPQIGDPQLCQSNLSIYVNDGEEYHVLYYQPNFGLTYSYMNSVYVLQYKGEIFLMFEEDSCPRDEVYILVYRLEAGVPQEKFYMNYKYEDMKVLDMQYMEEYAEWAEKICNDAMNYCLLENMVGSAEKPVEMGEEDYKLLQKMWHIRTNEYMERLDIENVLDIISFSGNDCPEIYISDLDNDGINEIYAKEFTKIGFYHTRNNLLYRTNGLFENEKYEGKWGAQYFILDNDEEVDFESICGLNAWNKGLIPQMFWIENNINNIVFIKYCDDKYYNYLIEGYIIHKGKYETVLSIEFIPEFSSRPVYIQNEKSNASEAQTYAIHFWRIKGDMRCPNIYGMRDEELQKRINENMEEMLRQEISVVTKDESVIWRGEAYGNISSASSEKLLLQYTIIYQYENMQGSYGKRICIEVNLQNGETNIAYE